MTDRDAIAHRYQSEADDSAVVARFLVRAWTVMIVWIVAWNLWEGVA